MEGGTSRILKRIIIMCETLSSSFFAHSAEFTSTLSLSPKATSTKIIDGRANIWVEGEEREREKEEKNWGLNTIKKGSRNFEGGDRKKDVPFSKQ